MVKRKFISTTSIDTIKTTRNALNTCHARNCRRNNQQRAKSPQSKLTRGCGSPHASVNNQDNSHTYKKTRGIRGASKKRNYRRNNVVHKKTNQKKDLTTCLKNMSFCESDESTTSSESNVHSNFYVDCSSITETNSVKSVESNQDFETCKPLSQLFSKGQPLSSLEGKKFVSKNSQESITEITFKSALLMHVKKTPTKNINWGKDVMNSSPQVIKVNQSKDLLSGGNHMIKPVYKFGSGNCLTQNGCSKSRVNLLKVKRSKNFTDLENQRKVSQKSIRDDCHQAMLPPTVGNSELSVRDGTVVVLKLLSESPLESSSSQQIHLPVLRKPPVSCTEMFKD